MGKKSIFAILTLNEKVYQYVILYLYINLSFSSYSLRAMLSIYFDSIFVFINKVLLYI